MGCAVCHRYPMVDTYKGKDYCRVHAPRVCEYCEKKYVPKGYKQIYCSASCAQKAHTVPKTHLERKCLHCGKVFVVKNVAHEYCSKECRKLAVSKELRDQYERDRLIIFDRDNFTCIYCGKSSYGDSTELHVDHIFPRSKGGTDTAGNLVTACIRCNLGKSDTVLLNEKTIIYNDPQKLDHKLR